MIGSRSFARPPLAAFDAEEIRELLLVGFHGTLNGKPEPALRLFEMLGALHPQEGFLHIGNAIAMLAVGLPPDEVSRVLETALQNRPQDDEIRVFLGMTLRIANRGQLARAVLEPLALRDCNTPTARLARRLLDLPL